MRKTALTILLLLIFVILGMAGPYKIAAWGGDLHDYLCPEFLRSVPGGCRIADDFRFQQMEPIARVENHLCLDNKPNCAARAVAKYLVKKYYVTGKEDLRLLAAAAHLIQDSYVPDHGYPMREYLGKIFVPFSPSWLGTTEDEVSRAIAGGEDFSLQREMGGKKVIINREYLAGVKDNVEEFVKSEPSEDLETLFRQAKTRGLWQQLRGYKELVILGFIIVFPVLIYGIWKWRRSGKISEDLVITVVVEGVFLAVLLAIHLFY